MTYGKWMQQELLLTVKALNLQALHGPKSKTNLDQFLLQEKAIA